MKRCFTSKRALHCVFKFVKRFRGPENPRGVLKYFLITVFVFLCICVKWCGFFIIGSPIKRINYWNESIKATADARETPFKTWLIYKSYGMFGNRCLSKKDLELDEDLPAVNNNRSGSLQRTLVLTGYVQHVKQAVAVLGNGLVWPSGVVVVEYLSATCFFILAWLIRLKQEDDILHFLTQRVYSFYWINKPQLDSQM